MSDFIQLELEGKWGIGYQSIQLRLCILRQVRLLVCEKSTVCRWGHFNNLTRNITYLLC